jgi:hypothetical protein
VQNNTNRNFKDLEEMLGGPKELIGKNGESKGIRIGPLIAPRFLGGRDSAIVYFTHCPNRAVGFELKFRGADGKPTQFHQFPRLDPNS